MDERRGAGRVEGPADFQAAMTMGNSTEAWTRHYDKNYQRRECQAGVNAMDVWRNHLLNRAGGGEPDGEAPLLLEAAPHRTLILSSEDDED